MNYIQVLEEELSIQAGKNLLLIQPGDVLETSANTQALSRDWHQPADSVLEGIKHFVEWYRDYQRALSPNSDKSGPSCLEPPPWSFVRQPSRKSLARCVRQMGHSIAKQ